MSGTIRVENPGSVVNAFGAQTADPQAYGARNHQLHREQWAATMRLLDALEGLCGPALAAPLKAQFTRLYEAGDEALDGYLRAVDQRNETIDARDRQIDQIGEAAQRVSARFETMVNAAAEEIKRRYRSRPLPDAFAALVQEVEEPF